MQHDHVQLTAGTREWAMLLALSLLWGGSFFFVGVAVSELPPLTIVTQRVGLAACMLWLVVAVTGAQLPGTARAWLSLLMMGIINNAIPFALIVWGQTRIASGLASILNATTPLFTVVVAGLLLSDERMTRPKIVGVLVGLAGAVLMIGPEALQGLGADLGAQLAILGAALSYAFAAVFGRRFRTMGIPPMVTAAGQVSGATLILLPAALLVEQPWLLPVPGVGTWVSILGLAGLSTALAYILYFRILASAGATNVLLVTFLVPVSAILLGAIFLDERLAGIHFLGMGLIGVGLAAIDGRLWRRLKRGRGECVCDG